MSESNGIYLGYNVKGEPFTPLHYALFEVIAKASHPTYMGDMQSFVEIGKIGDLVSAGLLYVNGSYAHLTPSGLKRWEEHTRGGTEYDSRLYSEWQGSFEGIDQEYVNWLESELKIARKYRDAYQSGELVKAKK